LERMSYLFTCSFHPLPSNGHAITIPLNSKEFKEIF
jgi:hypothetical protein